MRLGLPVRLLLVRAGRTALRVWERARSEHSAPREIGCSVALGVFAGSTPFYGAHLWLSLALATLLRLNRLWAAVGSRVSITPAFAVLSFCEIETAHRLRTGGWAALSARDALTHGGQLFGDWLLGTALVGLPLAAFAGALAYSAAHASQRRARLRPSTPDALPRRSSESRPSIRLARTP